jgi:2,4-dienoyl-CoA reductase-like NADH-dependent reductase (Old Yellow Enzyme family)
MSGHNPFRYKNRDQLLSAAEAIGLNLPFQENTANLLESVTVAGRTLSNRLAILPMEGCDGTEKGAPDELTFRRYNRYGAGGCGLIWFEATTVSPAAKANPRQLCLTEETLPAFKHLVNETRKASRNANPKIKPLLILQLTHPGRYTRKGYDPAPVIACHNPLLDRLCCLPDDHPLISDDALRQLQKNFLTAAELAVAAGFDGVDVKACHGYLLSELLSAHTRTDSLYGGPFENRIRFMIDTVKKIRQQLPESIIASRFNAWDGIEYPYGFGASAKAPQLPDFNEAVELAGRLSAAGTDLLAVTMGNPYVKPHYGRPYDRPLAGAAVPDENPLTGIDRMMRATREVQQSVPIPVVGCAYSWLRRFFPNVAAASVESGNVSIIGVGRNAFAYPDFPNDLASTGTVNEQKVCIACSCCSQIMRGGGRAGCPIRDAACYEHEYRHCRVQSGGGGDKS